MRQRKINFINKNLQKFTDSKIDQNTKDMASKLYGFDQVNNFADSNISQLSYYKNFNPNQSI